MVNAGGVVGRRDGATWPAATGVTRGAGKGIMIAMNHRLVHTCVNRCEPARRRRHPRADPHGLRHRHHRRARPTTPTTSTIGRDEVQQMLDAGEELVPGFRQARALHAWSRGRGRCSSDEQAGEAATTRATSAAAWRCVDHLRARRRERASSPSPAASSPPTALMAEMVVDAMCEQLGEPRRAARPPSALPGLRGRRALRARRPPARRGRPTCTTTSSSASASCCRRARLVEAARGAPGHEPGRRAPAAAPGHGAVPGRLLHATAPPAMLHGRATPTAAARRRAPAEFLQHRWIGLEPILYGDQMRQACLDDWIFQGMLDVEHLPVGGPRACRYERRVVGGRRRPGRAGRPARGSRRPDGSVTVVAKGRAACTCRRAPSTCWGTRPDRIDDARARRIAAARGASARTTPTPGSRPSRSGRRSRGSASWRRSSATPGTGSGTSCCRRPSAWPPDGARARQHRGRGPARRERGSRSWGSAR